MVSVASGPITKVAVLVTVSSGASHDCEAHEIVHVVPQLATPRHVQSCPHSPQHTKCTASCLKVNHL